MSRSGYRPSLTATLGLVTPSVRGFLSENAQQSVSAAIQVFGGHRYIRETGVECLVRSARVITLYEGTTGIQAQDLLLRKVIADNGQAAARWFDAVEVWLMQTSSTGLRGDGSCVCLLNSLHALLKTCREITAELIAQMACHVGRRDEKADRWPPMKMTNASFYFNQLQP